MVEEITLSQDDVITAECPCCGTMQDFVIGEIPEDGEVDCPICQETFNVLIEMVEMTDERRL